MEVKDNLKLLREQRKETLEEVAKAIGSSKQTIQRYETGEIKQIPYDKILSLAKHFDVSPGSLMGWEETPISDDMVSEHIELISLYEKLKPDEKENILETIRLLVRGR